MSGDTDTADVGENPGPGSRLRREREKQGLSAIEVAERLHLDPSVVAALEANRFASIGPQVYAKGHLKQYALMLGLPVGEIMAAYEAVRPNAPLASQPPPPLPLEPRVPLSDTLLPIGSAVIAVAIVASVLIAWKPWSPVPSQDAAPAPSAGAAGAALSPSVQPLSDASSADGDAIPGAASPSAAAGMAATAPQVAAPRPASAGAAAAPNAQGSGRARLRMSFSADSWVEVREAGGATVYRGKGAANSVKVISGVAPFSVYLGYVSGVQLEVNHHAVAIGPQFVHGDVARFEAGADGVLRRSPRP